MELMALLFNLLSKTRREGMMAIEKDIDSPGDSALFAPIPRLCRIR
ncbi:hypothetical protein ACFSHR_01940 [Azotobacter chroococcum]